MGQGQTGFQPLLPLHKLCSIQPSKQMATAQSTSNCELPSLARTCFISLLQNPTKTPQFHFQRTLGNNSSKLQRAFRAGRKYETLKPMSHSVSVPALLRATAAASSSWDSSLTQASFHLRGLRLMRRRWE